MSKPNNDDKSTSAPYQINNPEKLASNMVKMFEEGGKAMAAMMERSSPSNGSGDGSDDNKEAARVLGEVTKQWLQQPDKLAEAQGELIRSYSELWQSSVKRMMGGDADPVAAPEVGDNRFRDADWTENQYFDFVKQAYLLTSRWAEDLVGQTEGVDSQTQQRADFYMRQLTSAVSPSNFIFTNPEVMRETLASDGENLLRGLEQLSNDLDKSGDLLKISQTDVDAFEVGKNLAVTPGKVVYQNEILQLIQYKPSTKNVHEIPILIVPPWINKFYILDLKPEKSFIKYVVDQGFTVFVVSWVNPDETLASKSFEDYMHEGILDSARVAGEATGVKRVNVLGYCVGGTLLATTLAWLSTQKNSPIKSATFLTAQVDFTNAGDLMVFIDDEQLAALDEMMAERGYLDGSRMANIFNMLRPRDLIWPYVVNNYLLGKKPFPFDLLYWNQDSTRMPAANHGFYLREFYKENRLAKGEMEISGEKLDVGKVKIPIYELATREDHIAPAASVYKGARLFSGKVRYVLAGSGHIAGVVNPPDKMKYQYWTNNDTSAETLEDWLKDADETPGSWWPDWIKWLGKQSGEKIPPRTITKKSTYPPIEDAPGSYVIAKK